MRRLNILLAIPKYMIYGGEKYVMPLGILYVSAFLKRANVANVYTINLNHAIKPEREALKETIAAYDIDIFAAGGLSGEFSDLNRVINYAKEIKPGICTVVGGGIVTADPETTIQAFDNADYGIVGEGEHTIVELVQVLSEGKIPYNVDGLVFHKDGSIILTGTRAEILDLDSLPFPDYEGFDYATYLETNPDMTDPDKRYSQVSVIGGRSCKYNCTFCFHPSGSRYRQRSLDSIFAEIDYLVANYNISYIALREELFATDNKRVAEFCDRVKKYDFDWSIQLRIDSINQELIDLLRGSRCRFIFVGVESASNQILKSMHKGITVEQIDKALAMLAEAGLVNRSGIILGDTEETMETARKSIQWHVANKSRYALFIDMIIAFPGSIIYKRAVKSGIIPDPVQFLRDGCPVVNLTTMNDQEFAEIVSEVENLSNNRYNVKYYINR